MSYLAQSQLVNEWNFQQRNYACATQQAAATFASDPLADRVLRGDSEVLTCFLQLAAAGPGVADKADNGDGTIDQAKVTDAELLSLCQANWPTVARLYPPETP